MAELREGLNIEKSSLREFVDALKGRLGLIALSDEELQSYGLSLESVRIPMLVLGTPGVGKTCSVISTVNQVNKELPKEKKFAFKKIQLGKLVVGDLTGIPVVMPDGSVKRVQVPDLPPNDPKDPEFSEYGVLFLDEITTVDEAQMQPALGLADSSRDMGEYKLPEHWLVVAAGNGPDCTNFMRLDDAMLLRFETFDILYNYKTDWRDWAHRNGICEEIIAFLNFDETVCARVESTDMDSVGKGSPNPRTWELLSNNIKIYKATHGGEFYPQDEIAHRASRLIGSKAGREFEAFCAYRQKVDYSPEKILAGTEKDPDPNMEKQVFHIIIQKCITALNKDLAGKAMEVESDFDSVDYPEECKKKVANFVNWALPFEQFNFENCIQTFIEIRNTCDDAANILFRPDFGDYCPKFDDFLARNAAYLISNANDIATL